MRGEMQEEWWLSLEVCLMWRFMCSSGSVTSGRWSTRRGHEVFRLVSMSFTCISRVLMALCRQYLVSASPSTSPVGNRLSKLRNGQLTAMLARMASEIRGLHFSSPVPAVMEGAQPWRADPFSLDVHQMRRVNDGRCNSCSTGITQPARTMTGVVALAQSSGGRSQWAPQSTSYRAQSNIKRELAAIGALLDFQESRHGQLSPPQAQSKAQITT